jgi:hypothetical protein
VKKDIIEDGFANIAFLLRHMESQDVLFEAGACIFSSQRRGPSQRRPGF